MMEDKGGKRNFFNGKKIPIIIALCIVAILGVLLVNRNGVQMEGVTANGITDQKSVDSIKVLQNKVDDLQSKIDNRLKESNDNFKLAKKYYDEGNCYQTIAYASKVIEQDLNGTDAQSYIELCTERLKRPYPTITVFTQQPVYASPTQIFPSLQPTFNPNKDSICKNTASLDKMKLIDTLSNKLRETNPELFSFEEAKKKSPGEYTSQQLDDSYFFNIWARNSQSQLAAFNAGIQNTADSLYFQEYNNCLKQ